MIIGTRARILFIALLLLSILIPTPRANGFSSSELPAIRIGEQNTSNYGFLTPWGGLTFDPNGDLWVADSQNNRSLEFTPPFYNNMNAAVVIGQPSFQRTKAGTTANELNYPMYITFDHSGNLWISDSDNNRLLEFQPPFFNGMKASIVLGQQNFTASFDNTTRNGLSYPGQVAFDSLGNLWVPDGGNGRILEYQPPFTTGMNASLVLGEPDFTHRYCDPTWFGVQLHCSNHSSLKGPAEVAFDQQGNLWAPEVWSPTFGISVFKPPFSDGMRPSFRFDSVLAQNLAFDSTGNLWIACWFCEHVAEYKPPFSQNSIQWPNGPAPNATTNLGGADCCGRLDSISNVIRPSGVAFDLAGNLWVVDDRLSWLIVGMIGRVVGYDAQVHPLATKEGRVYFENHQGLLSPLSSIPIGQVGSLSFPDGLFNFTIQGLNSTESVTLAIAFPNTLPPTVTWWFNASGRWTQLPANQISVSGANLSLTLPGASSNGVISMVGGPATGTAPAQVSNTTSSANTSTSPTASLPNIGSFPVESIAGGIIAGLGALIILRYRKPLKQDS